METLSDYDDSDGKYENGYDSSWSDFSLSVSRPGVAQNQVARFSSDVLTTVFLEYICSLYAKNPKEKDDLKKLIMKGLTRNNLRFANQISDVHGLKPEFKSLVSDMIQSAVALITQQQQMGVIRPEKLAEFMQPRIINRTINVPNPADRYVSDYEEVSKIGRGGFGSVYKVRNKVDGNYYAIKKIIFRGNSPELWVKILQEVRILSRLHHENIVGYNVAWLEYAVPNMARKPRLKALEGPEMISSSNMDFSNNEESLVSNINENNDDLKTGSEFSKPEAEIETVDDSIVFSPSASGLKYVSYSNVVNSSQSMSLSALKGTFGSVEMTESNCVKNELSECIEKFGFGKVISKNRSEGSSPKTLRTKVPREYKRSFSEDPDLLLEILDNPCQKLVSKEPIKLQGEIILYIQMQLCDKTLSEWMKKRNSIASKEAMAVIDSSLNVCLFKQIVSGLQYVHSLGIIHRDLKPSNIFMVEKSGTFQVKIGDFGLACQINCQRPGSGFHAANGCHSVGVGTELYASPEQVKGLQYDHKTDVYSLGVIFYEMFHVYTTTMERYKSLQDLRKGILSKEIQEFWPEHCKIIILLTKEDKDLRPSLNEISHINTLSHVPQSLNDDSICTTVCSSSSYSSKSRSDLIVIIESRDKTINDLENELEGLRKKLKNYELNDS